MEIQTLKIMECNLYFNKWNSSLNLVIRIAVPIKLIQKYKLILNQKRWLIFKYLERVILDVIKHYLFNCCDIPILIDTWIQKNTKYLKCLWSVWYKDLSYMRTTRHNYYFEVSMFSCFFLTTSIKTIAKELSCFIIYFNNFSIKKPGEYY